MRTLIPNAITVLALCAGLTGLRFALAGEWERACIAVVIAGCLDGIDGRIARYLRGTSRFGAELDSLSDVIAFGVAPAVIIYEWALKDLPGLGWVIALAYAVCCALRLARFNANLDVDDQPHKQLGFNTGVPSPVGAGLTLSPIFLGLWLESDIFSSPWFVAPVVALTAFVMISALPTFSWKSLPWNRYGRVPLLLGIALFFGFLLNATWAALSCLALAYSISLILSLRSYHLARQRAQAAASPSPEPPASAASPSDPQ
jgi:CDP-diacylglycerol--serine O-phosphatidyltransferase